MAKYLIQIIVLGTQAVGKAFAKAVRQEYQASQAAAQARYAGRSRSGGGDSRTAAENMRLGMTVEEARQILNLSPEATHDEIQANYDFLFKMNDKAKGGSFYLQSKVYRAKERLDKDRRDSPPQEQTTTDQPPPADTSQHSSHKSAQP